MRVEFKNDRTRALEEMEGSDGRANTSSRSDSRGYYNSRDEGRSFSVAFDHQTAAAGEYSIYWKNTSTNRDLVISAIGVNSVNASRIKLWFVTGTAAGGDAITPTNSNKISSNAAEATAREANAGDAITGLATDGLIDFVWVQATGHEQLRLDDRVRLGQNDAIAIEYDEGTSGDFGGVIFGYYEET